MSRGSTKMGAFKATWAMTTSMCMAWMPGIVRSLHWLPVVTYTKCCMPRRNILSSLTLILPLDNLDLEKRSVPRICCRISLCKHVDSMQGEECNTMPPFTLSQWFVRETSPHVHKKKVTLWVIVTTTLCFRGCSG